MPEQVKQGYKQTEVGLIPEDWNLKILADVTKLIIDGTHHTPAYKDRGIPFLRVTDIQSSDINEENLKYISHEEHQILTKRCNPEKGDLLLSKNGTIGISKIVNWDYKFSIFVSLALIKVKQKELSVYYLDQLFKSDLIDNQIRLRSKQGSVTNLHLEEIREFLLPIPPIAEQEKIAEALSDVDSLIESLEELITKKRHIKQGAMQELLTGKRRLIDNGEWIINNDWKQTEIGLIPKDWKILQLCFLASIEGGFAFDSKKFLEAGKYQVIKMGNVYNDCLNLSRSQSYLDFLTEQEKKYILKKDEILITLTGTTGKRDYGYSYRIKNEENLLLNQRVARFVFKEEYIPAFFEYQLKTKFFYNQFFNISKGGTGNQTNVGIRQVSEVYMLVPTKAEQEAIAEVLTDMDNEIAALEEKLNKTRQLKQGMMQELLTGRIRLT